MIRAAKFEDLSEIVSIYNESIPERKATADISEISVESRLTWFNDHKDLRPLIVYEKNNEIAGWLSFQNFYGRPAYQATVEVSIYVKFKFKRQGIAKNLLSTGLQECPKLNISTVLGFIFAHNEPSINLVTNFGFMQWGFLPQIARLDGIDRDLEIYGLRI